MVQNMEVHLHNSYNPDSCYIQPFIITPIWVMVQVYLVIGSWIANKDAKIKFIMCLFSMEE